MENLEDIIKQNIDLISTIILSKPTGKYKKIKLLPKIIKNELIWQAEQYTQNQVFHNNLNLEQMVEFCKQNFKTNFKQINILLTNGEISGCVNKKGNISFLKNNKNKTDKIVTQHNNIKKYFLNEGTDIPFLRDLGIFTNENKIVQSKYDKFKQINRFVEILNDAFKNFNKKEITILDFGCGKSYLTFAVYYYFAKIKNIKPKIIGYGIKEDVVNFCNTLSNKYGYENLKFLVNDITQDNLFSEKVDMLITLHACDIATDFALKYGIKNYVPYIFSVPCCQHEINNQIKCGGDFDLLLKYGLIKERFSALLTDSIRAEILKDFGYKVDVLEFVDFAHSPKNIMLRCKLNQKKSPTKNVLINDIMEKYNFKQTLYNELYK